MTQQTLQALLCERVSEFAASDRPREIIDASVETMFKDLIKDAFRSYGDMGKQVHEAIKAAMPGNISDTFELTRYNALIANSMREQWLSSGIEGDMLRRANEAMEEALKENAIPAVVSLRGLIEAFIDDHKESATEERWEHPEVRFRESEYGGMHIFFDKEPESSHHGSSYLSRSERSDYQLDNAIHVSWSRDGSNKDEHGNPVGKVYAAQLEGKPIGKSFSIRNQWERLVAGLYFGAAQLVIDCGEDKFSYGLYD
jgi:hypothetical protein